MNTSAAITSTVPIVPPGTAVAVTGATGFIGGRLVECLVEQGANVTCLVRNPVANARLRATGAARVAVDLAAPEAVRAALAGVELVFHCAYDWNDAEWNVRALGSLIGACRTNGCRRLVHVSSFVVYDVPATGDVTEDTRGETSAGGYAFTKRRLEALVLEAIHKDGVPATIVQPTIVYGPYCRPWTIDPADTLRYGTVVLPDAGEGVCNAVYVDDVVSAMILAAQSPDAVGERFLVSGPAPVTWRYFYEELAEAIGAVGPTYMPAEVIGRAGSRAGKILRLVGDPGRAVRQAARVGPCRKLVEAALKTLPAQKRDGAYNDLFGPVTRRRGHVHLPSGSHLEFLQSRAVICSDKARAQLGYAPRHDLEAGMRLTAEYLNGRRGDAERKAG